jgi:endonuclease III
MDRQIPAGRAWRIPYEFRQRVNSFEFDHLRQLTVEQIQMTMSRPTHLHRFINDMTQNFYSAIQRIATQYDGNASNMWCGNPGSATVVRRFLQLDGVGVKIATMAANTLVRDFRIPVNDKFSIDVSPDVHIQRVFKRLGLVGPRASLEEIVYSAREMNPEYLGIFELSVWEIGRNWCTLCNPNCQQCPINEVCPGIEHGETAANNSSKGASLRTGSGQEHYRK